jgi:hypothetical protein
VKQRKAVLTMSSNSAMASRSECSLEGLNLFERPPIQTAITNSEWVMYKPLSSVENSSAIKVFYQGQPGVCIDMSRTLLRFDCKVTKADGTDIVEGADVATANYINASAFQQVDVELNGRLVSSSNSSYAYRGLIETLTSYSAASRSTWLKACGWADNTSAPVLPPALVNEQNGFAQLKAQFARSRTVTITGPLHLDMFQQDRLLLPNVGVLLSFIRNPAKFVINSASNDTEEYMLKITDLNVFFLQCHLSDAANIHIERQLLTSPALYPITRVDIRTFNIPSGVTAYSEDNAFVGQLPRRLLLTMISDVGYTGDYHTSPFGFNNYSMNYLSLSVGGRQIPNLPMTPRVVGEAPSTSNDEYMWFLAGMGKLFSNDPLGMDPAAWTFNGEVLYAFDVHPHMADDCLTPMEQGTVRINMRFGRPLANTTTLIVLAEFQNTVMIDRNRNVIHDF